MFWRKYKTAFLIPVVFLAVFLFSYSDSEAWPGCCSRHGGVCGCGCCDGSGLSTTCAPHYPECNSAPAPKTYTAPVAPVLAPAKPSVATTPTSPINIKTPTTPTNSTPSTPSASALSGVNSTSIPSQSSDDGSLTGGLAILALIGGSVWYFNKKNKK